MKKYITGGIAALITLTAICMMTGQSQASSHQQSMGDAICHQQNQGVIVCPGCQGKGNIGGQSKRYPSLTSFVYSSHHNH